MLRTRTKAGQRRSAGLCFLEYALALGLIVLGSVAGLQSLHVEVVASVTHLGDALASNIPTH